MDMPRSDLPDTAEPGDTWGGTADVPHRLKAVRTEGGWRLSARPPALYEESFAQLPIPADPTDLGWTTPPRMPFAITAFYVGDGWAVRWFIDRKRRASSVGFDVWWTPEP